jgi:agmatinase
MKKFGIYLKDFEEADVALLGVLLGKVAKRAVESIREQSWHVEFFDIDRKKNLLENLKIADLGNIEVAKHSDITKKVSEILQDKKIPFLIGGNHQLTLHALKTFKQKPKVLIFDAHTDLYDDYMDEKIANSVVGLPMSEEEKKKDNCATWARRFVENSSPANVAYFGVRSGCDEHMEFMQKNSIAYFTPKMLKENMQVAKDFITKFTRGQDVYITVDIDFFDPSFAPACSHPEPSGCSFPDFQELLSSVEGKIVGSDVNEVEPIVGNFVTEFLAVKTIYEILGKINEQI